MKKLMFAVVAALAGAAVCEATTVYSAANEQSGHSKITEKNDGKTDLWEGGAEANQPGVDYITTHQTRTVNATAAAALDGKIAVDRPLQGYRVTGVTKSENADDTVTFTAHVVRTGMVLIVR